MEERLNLLYSILIMSLWISQHYMSQTTAWCERICLLKLLKVWNECWLSGYFMDQFWAAKTLFHWWHDYQKQTLLFASHILLHLKTIPLFFKGHPQISTALDSCVYNHNFKLYIRFCFFLLRRLTGSLLRVVIYCGL